ncbi:Endonuclease/exonuclease/phosphatase [Lipomyces japonicus]|uniref:Endonuclease/exonuclease/phosphatase n=1 Tax=Lipomyces japonicus TaxID=56871 RepID=UPI0034CF7D02
MLLEETDKVNDYPDSSRANRRPPVPRSEVRHEISCKYDFKVYCVSGDYVCTSSVVTKFWRISDGQCIGHVGHPEYRVTAAAFKSSVEVDDEGSMIWLGTKDGVLLEIDVARLKIVNKRQGVHSSSIKGIFRCGYEMWTLDEDGRLQTWGPSVSSPDGLPSLSGVPKTNRVPVSCQYGIVVNDTLWIGRSRQVTVYRPSYSENQVQFAVSRPMTATQAVVGEITCATMVPSVPDLVFIGHDDGKVSVYSRSKLTCVDVISVSIYKITSMAAVGNHLWVGFRTGMVYVYDVRQRPWVVMKDWKAHDGPVREIVVDRSSIFKTGSMPVVTVAAAENVLTIWDGLLQHDWLETNMQEHDSDYCLFRTIKVLVCTWNVGAAKPQELQHTSSDAKFLANLVKSGDSPEIIVFGFQELIELDKKTVTAKNMFKHKKHKDKAVSNSNNMSHQYRAWQECLTEAVSHLESRYVLLHSDKLVGLFTCIFVKDTIRNDVSNLASSQVKTGLGGLHGNKGALISRFTVDHSSLCFVNCHLAAGQSHVIARNNDVANIMESKITSAVAASYHHQQDVFVGGGDGTMILDHEICFINGDMNYRINMHRVPVLKVLDHVSVNADHHEDQGNDDDNDDDGLGKLLAADQLLGQLRKNPGFRLRPFSEPVIKFKPTYKYDIGTDTYDSSDKKRTPAWCDRIFYRGGGGSGNDKIVPVTYRAHQDVRVSDHRPVSGSYEVKIKTIDSDLAKIARKRAHERWNAYVHETIEQAKLHYLANEHHRR